LFASALPIASPSPDPPPVTIATFPSMPAMLNLRSEDRLLDRLSHLDWQWGLQNEMTNAD
jgi:hypothetical protein